MPKSVAVITESRVFRKGGSARRATMRNAATHCEEGLSRLPVWRTDSAMAWAAFDSVSRADMSARAVWQAPDSTAQHVSMQRSSARLRHLDSRDDRARAQGAESNRSFLSEPRRWLRGPSDGSGRRRSGATTARRHARRFGGKPVSSREIIDESSHLSASLTARDLLPDCPSVAAPRARHSPDTRCDSGAARS